MRQPIYRLVITLFVFCVAITFAGAQQRHRRQRRPISKANEVKPVNVNQAAPEETAKFVEECAFSEKPKPETATKVPVLCGKAISLPKPPYPEAARAAKVSGVVTVSAVMDETGRVIWARAVNGHPLLQSAAVKAACLARYSPTLISGRAVKAETIISYNFVSH